MSKFTGRTGFTCSAATMARQEHAASQMMKEMVQARIEQAERDGYNVEWVGHDEMVLTEKEQNNG